MFQKWLQITLVSVLQQKPPQKYNITRKKSCFSNSAFWSTGQWGPIARNATATRSMNLLFLIIFNIIYAYTVLQILAFCWSSGNAFVSGAGGLRFKARAVKSDTVLPTARHRCNISSKGVVLLGCNDAEIGPANSFHSSSYYRVYNERFDLI